MNTLKILSISLVVMFGGWKNLKTEVNNVEYYYAKEGVLVPKYGLITISDSSLIFEVYMPWQGQILAINQDTFNILNSKIYIISDSSKTKIWEKGGKLYAKISQSFAGPLEFNFSKKKVMPNKLNELRNKSLMFSDRDTMGDYIEKRIGKENFNLSELDRLRAEYNLYKMQNELNSEEFRKVYYEIRPKILNQILSRSNQK